jgi:hypothetical protein
MRLKRLNHPPSLEGSNIIHPIVPRTGKASNSHQEKALSWPVIIAIRMKTMTAPAT